MFNIVKIVKLFEIEYKKHYIMSIERVAKDDKARHLK